MGRNGAVPKRWPRRAIAGQRQRHARKGHIDGGVHGGAGLGQPGGHIGATFDFTAPASFSRILQACPHAAQVLPDALLSPFAQVTHPLGQIDLVRVFRHIGWRQAGRHMRTACRTVKAPRAQQNRPNTWLAQGIVQGALSGGANMAVPSGRGTGSVGRRVSIQCGKATLPCVDRTHIHTPCPLYGRQRDGNHTPPPGRWQKQNTLRRAAPPPSTAGPGPATAKAWWKAFVLAAQQVTHLGNRHGRTGQVVAGQFVARGIEQRLVGPPRPPSGNVAMCVDRRRSCAIGQLDRALPQPPRKCFGAPGHDATPSRGWRVCSNSGMALQQGSKAVTCGIGQSSSAGKLRG